MADANFSAHSTKVTVVAFVQLPPSSSCISLQHVSVIVIIIANGLSISNGPCGHVGQGMVHCQFCHFENQTLNNHVFTLFINDMTMGHVMFRKQKETMNIQMIIFKIPPSHCYNCCCFVVYVCCCLVLLLLLLVQCQHLLLLCHHFHPVPLLVVVLCVTVALVFVVATIVASMHSSSSSSSLSFIILAIALSFLFQSCCIVVLYFCFALLLLFLLLDCFFVLLFLLVVVVCSHHHLLLCHHCPCCHPHLLVPIKNVVLLSCIFVLHCSCCSCCCCCCCCCYWCAAVIAITLYCCFFCVGVLVRRCSSNPDEQTDRWTCSLGVCLYILVMLEVVNLARN